MALYRPVQSWMNASEAVKIIGTEQGDGFTVYRIQVSVTPYCWVAKHRYSDFKELHAKLRRSHHVERTLLPPGKLLGRQAASFVQQRQAELEHYLVTLVHHFADGLPLPLARFLLFHQFVRAVLLRCHISARITRARRALRPKCTPLHNCVVQFLSVPVKISGRLH